MRKILGDEKDVRSVRVSSEGKILCLCGKPGTPRVDNDLPSGIHCETCWSRLLVQCKSKSW